MGTIKRYILTLVAILFATNLFAQLSVDLEVSNITILPPSTTCQGTAPEIQVQIENNGASTITLTSTNTIILTAYLATGLITDQVTAVLSQFTPAVTTIPGLGGSVNYTFNRATEPVVTALVLNNSGATNLTVVATVSSTAYSEANSSDNTRTISFTVTPQPTSDNLVGTSEGNFNPSREITVCSSTPVTIEATGSTYTAWEWETKPAASSLWTVVGSSTVASFTFSSFVGTTHVRVKYYQGSCTRYSPIHTVFTEVVPSISLVSDKTNNVVCDTESITFTAGGSGGWFEFLEYDVSAAVTTSIQSSTLKTYSSSSLGDLDVITVRSYTSSSTDCYSESQIQVRVNAFTTTPHNINGNETLCSGTIPFTILGGSEPTPTIGAATKTYQWQFNSGGVWTDISGAVSQDFIFTTGLTTTTAYRRKIISEFNGVSCEDISNVVTKTVNIQPDITVFSIGSPSVNNSVCDTDDVELNITATNTNSPVYRLFRGINLIQGPVSGGATHTFTVSGTDLDNGDLLTVTVENSGATCSGTATLTIFINEFDFSTSSNTISGNQSVCFSLSPSQLSDVGSPTATGSITISWESRTLGTTSWTLVPSVNTANYTPSSVATATEFRRILTSDLNGKTCESYSNIVTINVPTVTASLVIRNSATLTALDANMLCEGDSIQLDASGSTGVAGYQFFRNGTSLSFGAVVTTSTTVVSSPINHNDVFSVRVYLNADGSGCAETVTETVLLNALTGSHSVTTASQTVCIGDTPATIAASVPTANISTSTFAYQWEHLLDGTTTWTVVPGVSTLPSLNPPSNLSAGVHRFRRKITLTNGTLSCTDDSGLWVSSVHLITVTANPTGTISTSTTSVCIGSTVTFTLNGVSGLLGETYQFFIDGVGQGTSTATTFSTNSLATGQQVSAEIYANSCTTTTAALTMGTYSLPTPALSGLTQNTFCRGDFPDITATPTGSGFTYTFYLNNIQIISSAVSGNVLSTASITTPLNHGDQLSVRVTNPGGCSSTETITLNINEFDTGTTDSISTTTTAYCSGADPLIINSVSTITNLNGGSLSYAWETRQVSPSTTSWTVILNATNTYYDPPVLADGTHEFRRQTTNTFNTLSCVSTYTSVVTITVGSGVPAPSLTVTITDNATTSPVTNFTICPDDAITISASSTTGQSYEFFINGANVQGPSSLDSLVVSSVSHNDSFSVIVYSDPGGVGCTNQVTYTIQVIDMVGNNTITNTTQTICEGDDPSAIVAFSNPTPTIPTGNVRYQWQRFTTVWEDILGATTQNYDPAANVVTVTTQFRRLATVDYNGVSCSGTSSPSQVSNYAIINVVPSFTASLTSSVFPIEICSGSSIQFTANAVASATYTFMKNGNPVQTGSSAVYSDTFLNGDSITVEISNGSCTRTSSPSVVLVYSDPLAQLNVPSLSTNVFCVESPPSIEASPSTGVSYTFYISDGIVSPTIAPAGAVSGNTIDLSHSSIVLTPKIVVDVQITDANGCQDSTSEADGDAIVLYTSELTGTNNINTGQTSYCAGVTPNPIYDNGSITPSLSNTTLNYVWQQRTAGTTTWTNVGITTQNFNPPQLADGSYEFRRLLTYTVSGVTCTPTSTINISNIVTLTFSSSNPVTLSSNISPTGSNIICDGDDIIFTASTTSATNYIFSVDSITYQSSASPTFDTSAVTLTLTDGALVKVIAEFGSSSCTTEDTYVIRVNSMTGNNNITYTSTTTLCGGEDPSPIGSLNEPTPTLQSDGAFMQYQWQSFNGTTWSDITGETTVTFDPGPIYSDISFRRLALVNYNGIVCEDPVINYISNTVTFTVFAGPSPLVTLLSNEANNTICEGATVTFTTTVTGATTPSYLFRRNGVAQALLPDTQSTMTVSNILDGEVITVEVFPLPGRSGCSTTETLTMFVNSFDATPNQIGIASATICSGADPGLIYSSSIPVATGSVTYRWESKTPSSTLWSDLGVNNPTYDPPVLANTTVFRRIVYSTLNTVQCESISNIVTITIDPNLVPTITSFSSNRVGNTICSGSTSNTIFTVTATGTITRYDFRLNGTVVQSSVSNTYSLADSSITDGSTVFVEVFGPSGCFDTSYTITLTINDIVAGFYFRDTICV